MFGSARVYKQSNRGYAITVPMSIVKTLQIKPGNRIEFDILNPRPETLEEATHKGRFAPKSSDKAVGEPHAHAEPMQATPAGPEQSVVPEHVIERVFAAKAKGVLVEQLKIAFSDTTDYQWSDLPEKVRKELEA